MTSVQDRTDTYAEGINTMAADMKKVFEIIIDQLDLLEPLKQMQVVEHLNARMAFKMGDVPEGVQVLDGIRKHSRRLLQEWYEVTA